MKAGAAALAIAALAVGSAAIALAPRRRLIAGAPRVPERAAARALAPRNPVLPVESRAFAPRGRAALLEPSPPPPGAVGAALAADAAADLATLPGWTALAQPGSGRAARLFGPPIDTGARDDAALAAFASELLAAHRALVGLPDGATLSLRGLVHAGRFAIAIFDERFDGISVEGGRVDVRFVGSRLVDARLTLFRDFRGVDAASRLDDAAARAAVLDAALADVATLAGKISPAGLAVVAGPRGLRLARAADVDVTAPLGRLRVWVDAADGTPLAMRDAIRRGTPTSVTVQGTHEPRRAGDPPVLEPFGFDDVDTAIADTSGVATLDVPAQGLTARLTLDGAFTHETLFSGSAASVQLALSPGAPVTFTWDDSSATLAERDVYRSRLVVHARHKAMAPELAWVDSKVGYELEIADSQGCNAFWDGLLGTVELYAESATCNDTARVADVVYHETTHGLHQHLSSGGLLAADVGEGSADYVAATINDDPDIGPSFYKATGAGIRNLSTLEIYPDDLTGEPHSDGVIWGGAFWDLRETLIAEEGYDAGVATTDRLLADTLRLDPTMGDGFWDVIAADDDDADLSDGTPHECEIADAFGRHGLGPGNGLVISTVPIASQAPGPGQYAVRAHIAPAFPHCAGASLVSATVEWRLAGAPAWTAMAMQQDLVPGWRIAEIPAQAEGATVEYRLRAQDTDGRETRVPNWGFDDAPLRFPVETTSRIFFDDFETDRGWTHVLVSGAGAPSVLDDWERGTPRGLAGDPMSAFSGANAWGTDLGVNGTDGAYPANVEIRLTSPVIDCRRASGTKLRFRRWLNVESAPEDIATVRVNDHVVWTNPAGTDVRDRVWRAEEIDVSPWADGRDVRISFDLKTDGAVSLGGWNVDDVEVVATGTRPLASGCEVDTRPAAPAASAVAGLGALVLAWALRRARAPD